MQLLKKTAAPSVKIADNIFLEWIFRTLKQRLFFNPDIF